MRPILWLAASVLLAAPLRAQEPAADTTTASIVGVVTDSLNLPVAGAEVGVVGTALEVVTDAAGRFRLTGIPPGQRTIRVRAIGFEPKAFALTLAAGQTAEGHIALTRLAVALPEIEVAGVANIGRVEGYERRRRSGNGIFIDQAAIQNRNAFSTADLFDGIPGIKVRRDPNSPGGVSIVFNRCPTGRIAVYYNGLRMSGPVGQSLGLIPPGDIYGIEVYRGTSELPGEFGTNACAAIAVWTR